MKPRFDSQPHKENQDKIRLDKWLWAARFFKTRQLAVKAIKTGKISVNKNNAKPATAIQLDDLLLIKRGYHQIEITVIGLSEKRGPAPVAQALYQETERSIVERERMSQEMAAQPRINFDPRKPDKRDVRTHRAIKRGD